MEEKIIGSLQLEIIELNDEINITAGATFAACTIDDNSINEFIQFLGEVKLMDDKEEKVKACEILKNIFPYSKYWIYSNDILFFKIKPTTIKYYVGPADIAKGKYCGDIYEINL